MTDDIAVLKRMVERYGAHFRMDDDYYEALALLDGATGLVKAGDVVLSAEQAATFRHIYRLREALNG